jgi:hypothetical protein
MVAGPARDVGLALSSEQRNRVATYVLVITRAASVADCSRVRCLRPSTEEIVESE